MALVDEIAVKLGLKTADFKAALKAANVDVAAFKKAGTIGENEGMLASLKKITQRIAQFRSVLLGGGLAAALRGVFQNAVSYAEKFNGGMDEGVAATLRLRDAFKELKDEIGKVSSDTIGLLERVRLVYIAVTRGPKAAVEAAQKSREANKSAFDDNLVKRTKDATEGLAKVRLRMALDAASKEDRISILYDEHSRLLKEQLKVKDDIVEKVKAETDIVENLAEIRRAEREFAEEEAEHLDNREKFRLERLDRKNEAEEKATKETKKQRENAEKQADAWDRIVTSADALNTLEKNFEDAKVDPSKQGLDDIAAGAGGTTQTNKARAKEILRLERDAIRARAGGFGDIADKRLASAAALRQTLSPVLKSGEIDPLEKQREAIATASRDLLKEIRDHLKPEALDQ